MSVIDNEVRADVAVDPRTHCVGRAAVARHVEATFGVPLDADELAALADVGKGPPVERIVDGQDVFDKRALEGWVLKEYGAHDGTASGIGTLLSMFFSFQGGPGLYVPKYCAETGKVDLVWIEETKWTDEQIAKTDAERDRLDPPIEPE